MKKLVLVVSLALAISAGAFAQGGNKRHSIEEVERFKAAKTAYFTQKLELTPEQSERFWPLYDQVHKEQRSVFREVRKKKHALLQAIKDGKGDTEVAPLLSNWLEAEKTASNPMYEHRADFVEILGEVGTARLYLAEEGFRNEIIRKLAGGAEEK